MDSLRFAVFWRDGGTVRWWQEFIDRVFEISVSAQSLPPPRAMEQTNNRLLGNTEWRRVGEELMLSPRELELVRHIFEGKKLCAAGYAMNVSLGTIKTYGQRIYRKLGVRDQRELVLMIVRTHLELSRSA